MKQIQQDLRKGLSINQVCEKYDMTFSQLFKGLKRHQREYRNLKNRPLPKYIYQTGNRFRIQYRDGRLFGSYFSYNEVCKVRKKLIELNWNADPNDYMGDMYLVRYQKDWAIHYKGKFFIRCRSQHTVRKIRDKLVKVGWDKSKLPMILKELEGEL